MTDRPGVGAWFAPRVLGLHVFAIAAIAFCLFMGSWQWGVYDQRQADQTTDQGGDATVPLLDVWAPGEVFTKDHDQQSVEVTGTFRPASEQLWVTGQTQGDDEGVWLVAPVTVADAELLVVRGWTPEQTATFPEVPAGEVTFDAVLQPGDASSTGWDPEARTIGAVRIPTLLNELGYGELWSGYAVSTDGDVAGPLTLVEIDQSEVSWTQGGRNLGYGLQWWVFAAFTLFMWWRMAREIVLGSDR